MLKLDAIFIDSSILCKFKSLKHYFSLQIAIYLFQLKLWEFHVRSRKRLRFKLSSQWHWVNIVLFLLHECREWKGNHFYIVVKLSVSVFQSKMFGTSKVSMVEYSRTKANQRKGKVDRQQKQLPRFVSANWRTWSMRRHKKLRTLDRPEHTKGQVPATSPYDKSLEHFTRREKSLWLVMQIQTCLNSQDKSQGLFPFNEVF